MRTTDDTSIETSEADAITLQAGLPLSAFPVLPGHGFAPEQALLELAEFADHITGLRSEYATPIAFGALQHLRILALGRLVLLVEQLLPGKGVALEEALLPAPGSDAVHFGDYQPALLGGSR